MKCSAVGCEQEISDGYICNSCRVAFEITGLGMIMVSVPWSADMVRVPMSIFNWRFFNETETKD
jgi:hypothetical protein